PNLNSLVEALKASFFVRLTGTNVSEIAATPDSKRRTSLLDLCRTLADDYLSPYHWITNNLIAAYKLDPVVFDWWNVPAESPELQEELMRIETFDDVLAQAQRKDHKNLNQNFKRLFTTGRKALEK